MRASDRYYKSPFSLRALFGIHSSSNYPRQHHGHSHRRSHRSRRDRDTPRPPVASSSYYSYPTTYPAYASSRPSYSQNYPSTYQPSYTPTYQSSYDTPRESKRHHRQNHHSKSSKPKSSRRTNLNSLPPELKHAIHSSLDPVSSACLGLSSRHYYPIHRSHHPKVTLFTMATPEPTPPPIYDCGSQSNSSPKTTSHPLYVYLNRDKTSQFVPKESDGYVLDPRTERYVRRSRYEEDERRRKRNGGLYQWEEGRAERERELRRIWGREGKLARRRGRGWFW